MCKIVNNKKGFTMVEMLISMAIFVTALTAISAIFAFANKSQRTTKAVSDVQADARFAMEVMAQQVRRGSIDYDSTEYGGSISSNPQDVLVLRDSSNNQVWFRRNTSGSQGVVQMSEDGSTWVDLTPPDISVDILKFYLSPSTNPFIASPATNTQPKVTITMVTSSLSTRVETLLPTYLQTTIASRQYTR
jgi:prepilin-type N-terminal cleavage/methylation domain-containing protein